MDAAAREHVRDTSGTVGSGAFLARTEVVHACRARRVDVSADDHRRALSHRLDDVGEIDLVKVNHLRLERQRLADALDHRRIVVEQVGAR